MNARHGAGPYVQQTARLDRRRGIPHSAGETIPFMLVVLEANWRRERDFNRIGRKEDSWRS